MNFEEVIIKSEFGVFEDMAEKPVETMPAIKQESPEPTSTIEVPQLKMEPPDDQIEIEEIQFTIKMEEDTTVNKSQTVKPPAERIRANFARNVLKSKTISALSNIPSGTLPKQKTIVRRSYECLYCQCQFNSHKGSLLNHMGPDVVFGPRKCVFCDRTFPSYRCCRSHMDHFHLAAHPVECEICSKPFHATKPYEQHMRKTHSIYDCNLCRARFASASKWKVHRLSHKPIENRFCKQCGKTFSSLSNLREHVNLVHVIDWVTCGQCDKEFLNNQRLYRHMVREHGTNPTLLCQECGFQTNRKTVLKEHIQSRHNKDDAYECTVCRNRFPTDRSLACHWRKNCGKNHSKKERAISQRYECIYCKCRFERLRRLLSHQSNNHYRGPINCVYCHRSFPSFKCCVRHTDHVHLVADPIKCEICSEPFHVTSLYDQHLRKVHSIYVGKQCPDRLHSVQKWAIHRSLHHSDVDSKCPHCVHSVEPLKCDVCDSVFQNRQKMMRHKNKVHKTAYMFQCNICLNRFPTADVLNRHLETICNLAVPCASCGLIFDSHEKLVRHAADVHDGIQCGKCGEHECNDTIADHIGNEVCRLNRSDGLLTTVKEQPFSAKCSAV